MVKAVVDTIDGQDIEEERSPEEVMEIWSLIEMVAKEFIESNP